jgi:ubiquinone/menaquinone biosynthesis C-methylase UbiE
MNTSDVYGATDKLSDTILEVVATRLEARGKFQSFQKMMKEYLNAMNIDSAKTVLDLGCGTGVATRGIIHRTNFSGTITGIDLSSYLVEVAKQLSEEDVENGRIFFRTGDTRSLEIPDETFDAVVAHTLISHVDDPLAALKEATRIVKKGGMIGIFDGDYASLTFSHEDPIEGKKYDEAIIKALITNPWVMRQMPRFLRDAGLDIIKSFSYIIADYGKIDFWTPAIESFRKLIPHSGTMTDEQINTWADHRLKESEDSVFFGACNYYSYVAKRPW